MRTTIFLTCCLLLASAPLWAQQERTSRDDAAVELALSDETAQISYDTRTSVGGRDSRALYSVFLSEDRDVVGSAALLLPSDFHWGAFDLSFGPQAYGALLNEENEDVFALAVGAELRFNLIPSRAIALVGSAFWSPDILTFGAADNLMDLMARAEMRLTDRLVGFAGYRWFELDLLMREDRELQNELFAGVRWQLH
jgi:YfaZ precursor